MRNEIRNPMMQLLTRLASHSRRRRTSRADQGSVLPLTLVLMVTLSVATMGIVSYTYTDIRFGAVVEDRADRLSAAEAGMRHVLEKVQAAGTLCTTAPGADGVDISIPDTISGATVSVNCELVGGNLSYISGWAVIITAEGLGPNDDAFITAGANVTKTFGGPSYVARPSNLAIDKELLMRDGDLWYTDTDPTTCDIYGEYKGDGSGPEFGALSFEPATRGVWCTPHEWDDLFPRPFIPTLPTTAPPPSKLFGTCTVFYPGRYTSQPVWGNNNYMMSGNYVFDDVGDMVVGNKTQITAGREGIGGSEQEIDNVTDCDEVRDNEDPDFGATFYMNGHSSFSIIQQGALEITRREQSGTVNGKARTDYISMQTLPAGEQGFGGSTLDAADNILNTGPGNKKQMAIHGQVYAPYAGLEFGNVANTAIAQLSGGVVLARIEAQAAASVTGFVIAVKGSPQTGRFAFTATAQKGGATTQVRVVAELRYSSSSDGISAGSWDLAMNSWRVCDGLCT